MAQGSVHTMLVAFASGSDSDTQVNTTGGSHRRRMVVGGTVCMAVALVGVLWRSCGRKDLATPSFMGDSLVSLAAKPPLSDDEMLCGHRASVCVSDLDSYGSVFFTKDCLYGGVGCSALDWTCCRFCGFATIKCPKDAKIMEQADAKTMAQAGCEKVWADIKNVKAAIEKSEAAIAKAQADIEKAEAAANENAIKEAQSRLFSHQMDAEKAHQAIQVANADLTMCSSDKAAAVEAAANKHKAAADKIAADEAGKVLADRMAAYQAAAEKLATAKIAVGKADNVKADKEKTQTAALTSLSVAKDAVVQAQTSASQKIAAEKVSAIKVAEDKIAADKRAAEMVAARDRKTVLQIANDKVEVDTLGKQFFTANPF